jgi:hypothetical protein
VLNKVYCITQAEQKLHANSNKSILVQGDFDLFGPPLLTKVRHMVDNHPLYISYYAIDQITGMVYSTADSWSLVLHIIFNIFVVLFKILCKLYYYKRRVFSPYEFVNCANYIHGLINKIGTKAKCRHLKKLICKGVYLSEAPSPPRFLFGVV